MATFTEEYNKKLTATELQERSDELSMQVQKIDFLRDQRKSAVKDWDAQIEACNKRTRELARIIGQRYEVVEIEVVEIMNEGWSGAEPGKKKIVNSQTLEAVDVRDMDFKDRQADFGFGMGLDPGHKDD